MRSLALAALFLAASLPATAYAQMYKCVDESGATHYSDKPRPGCKGGKVDIQASPPLSGKANAPRANLPQQDADFRRRQSELERAQALDKAALGERCARLRHEHAWLTSGGRISENTAQGRVYVDDASRDTRLMQVKEGLRTCPQ